MHVKDRLKHILRMFGHAVSLSVHERLASLEIRLDDINIKLNPVHVKLDALSFQISGLVKDLTAHSNHLAEADAALLHGSIHLVEQMAALLDQSRRSYELIEIGTEEDRRARVVFRNHVAEHIGLRLEEQGRSLSHEISRLLRAAEERINQSIVGQQEHYDTVATSTKQLQSDVTSQMLRLEASLDDARQAGKLIENIRSDFVSQLLCLEASFRELSDVLSKRPSAFEISPVLAKALCDLGDLNRHVGAVVDSSVRSQVCVETDDYGLRNPEIGLLQHLYSYLPIPALIDVGSHVGEFAERLLDVGYDVYAFEPAPDAYIKLLGRLQGRERFHPFNVALGSREGKMPLFSAKDLSGSQIYDDVSVFKSLTKHAMPVDLPFVDGGEMVQVTTLAKLAHVGSLPSDAGVLKIDTEGFDLEVIRGMGDLRFPVVQAEYWDAAIPFGRSGLLYTLHDLTREMRTRGYRWHIVLYRLWGCDHMAYYCNYESAVPNSWGNAVFFKDYDLFSHGQSWCAAVLPRTYFKAVSNSSAQRSV